MKSRFLLALGMLAVAGFGMPHSAIAQDDEGPGTRVMTVTTWDIPYGEDRGTFMQWFQKWFLPQAQLNPNVLNLRIAFHQWGSNGDQILMVSEYASMQTFAADCGEPCSDWDEANPTPEEGDDGYEEFQEGLRAFQKYYSHHGDEIFTSPMGMAKVEGEVLGTIGGSADEEDGDN